MRPVEQSSQEETAMTNTQTKIGVWNKFKRSVGMASTGGMIGYAASVFLMLPVPQVAAVVVGLVGGVLVAKATRKKL